MTLENDFQEKLCRYFGLSVFLQTFAFRKFRLREFFGFSYKQFINYQSGSGCIMSTFAYNINR